MKPSTYPDLSPGEEIKKTFKNVRGCGISPVNTEQVFKNSVV